jgi:hypothetical protein
MAAPAVQTRQQPVAGSYKMHDGFPTTIALQNVPNIAFWEEAVTPPGVDGGDAIPTTTMLNTRWRTMDTRSLLSLGAIQCAVMYDPDVYVTIIGQINRNQAITVRFPTSDSITFFGFLQKFEPAEQKEGEAPHATITITPTNWDPVNSVEAGPVYTAAAGT